MATDLLLDTAAPTIEQIIVWLYELRAEDGGLDREAQAEEDLYFQSFDLVAPEGFKTVRLGTAPGDVDQAVETASPGDYIGVKVIAAKDTQDWIDRADARQKWLRALVERWRENEDIIDQLLWAMIVQRRRWAQVSYNPLPPRLQNPPTPQPTEAWDSFEARAEQWQQERDGWDFIQFELKPRGAVMARTVNGKHQYVFEEFTRSIADLLYWYPLSRFPKLRAILKGRSVNETVTFTQFWSDDWRCALVDDQPFFPSSGVGRESLGVVRNEYGLIPFVEFYFRKLPITADNARAYRGFLSNAHDSYKLESQVASQYLTIITRAAWPTILTRLLDNRPFVMAPGMQFPLRPGEAVESFEGQGPLPEVGAAWERLRAAIRQNALGAAGGNMPAGVRSAEALTMVSQVDRNKVNPALKSLSRGLRQAARIALKIVENVHREPITLPISGKDKSKGGGRALKVVTLGPDDVRGYYDCAFSFGPTFGADVFQRAQALDALVKDKFLARERAWRLVPEIIDSIDDAQQELIQEASDNHPLMVIAHVMRRLSSYDPKMFRYMMQVGAFSPNATANQGAPGGAGSGPTPGASPAAMLPPGGGTPPGPQPGGPGTGAPPPQQQQSPAVAGSSPVRGFPKGR